MPIYEIHDNAVIAHAAVPAKPGKGGILVESLTQLEGAELPMPRLVALWNALPGVTAVTKFKDRKTAAKRLWAAFAELKPRATRSKGAAEDKPARGDSKQAQIIALLRRPEGATIEELVTATSWQAHSVRGVMSGALKKRLGLEITSTKEARGRTYRIPAAGAEERA